MSIEVKHLHRRSRRKQFTDANLMVSHEWTDKVRRAVLGLPEYSFGICYLKGEFLSKYVGPETTPLAIRQQRAIEKMAQAGGGQC